MDRLLARVRASSQQVVDAIDAGNLTVLMVTTAILDLANALHEVDQHEDEKRRNS